MYKLYKRRIKGELAKNWSVNICINGKQLRRSTGTTNRQQAQQFAVKLHDEAWRQIQLGDRPNYSWDNAVVRWAKLANGSRTYTEDLRRLKILDRYVGGLPLKDISTAFLSNIYDQLIDERELSNATANRYMALIRYILNSAANDWDMLEKAPKVVMRKTVDITIVPATIAQAKRLISFAPKRHKAPLMLGFNCGLRKANLYGLKWSQLDMARQCAWINGDEAKGKRAIPIPLNTVALEIIRKQIGKHPIYVFNLNPMIHRTWKRLVVKAGIPNFRQHDIRHTWASWHVMNGTSLQELMELGGWSSIRMVMRYAHFTSQHLQAASERVSTNLAHSEVLEIRSGGK